jgi:hypothetical protein
MKQGEKPTMIFHVSADTDAHAMLALKTISGADYKTVEIWRDQDRIYVGEKPLRMLSC